MYIYFRNISFCLHCDPVDQPNMGGPPPPPRPPAPDTHTPPVLPLGCGTQLVLSIPPPLFSATTASALMPGICSTL